MRPKSSEPYSFQKDAAVPEFDPAKWVVVMDAECALCSSVARRIARLDKADKVRIAPSQSALGAALMRHYGLDPDDPQSWLLVKDGYAFGSLQAIILLFSDLNRIFLPLKLLQVLPLPVQDWLYARVARNRYALFGKGDMCAIPDTSLQTRLLR